MKRRSALLASAVMMSIVLHPGAARAWYPATNEEMAMPALQVFDETGHSEPLEKALRSTTGGPALLVPVFTKCHMSCPVLVGALKSSLASVEKEHPVSFRVLVLSFDATDTTEDLKKFRAHENIPSSWQIVRAQDQSSVREFFDQFSYSIMDSDGGFAHPSQVFVLGPGLQWIGSLLGPNIRSRDAVEAYKRASISEDRGWFGKISRLAHHPEALVVIGALGFFLSLLVAFGLAVTGRSARARTRGPSACRFRA